MVRLARTHQLVGVVAYARPRTICSTTFIVSLVALVAINVIRASERLPNRKDGVEPGTRSTKIPGGMKAGGRTGTECVMLPCSRVLCVGNTAAMVDHSPLGKMRYRELAPDPRWT